MIPAGWENFYVVTASAAATLIGLMFVVITLGADVLPSVAGPAPARATKIERSEPLRRTCTRSPCDHHCSIELTGRSSRQRRQQRLQLDLRLCEAGRGVGTRARCSGVG